MKVGIQLYSVRNNMSRDPVDTIKKVAEAGYRYLEAANHNAAEDFGVGFGVSASEIKEILDTSGAFMVSSHINPLRLDTIDAILEYHHKVGTQYLASDMAFFRDKDDILHKAENFNKIGEKCAAAGIPLLYHNHFHEFQIFEGQSIFDILMSNTDPHLLKIELDTYWAMRGDQDPVDLLERYGNRVRLIHQKDFPAALKDQINLIDVVNRDNAYVDMDYFDSVVSEDAFTEIGTGLMDIQRIINQANAVCSCDYIILEQDYTAHDEMESIRISMAHFKKFTGIQW